VGVISKMKVLVTGGAGFIGSWVVERLLTDGDEVLLLDDFSTGDRRNLEHLMDNTDLSIIEGDIRDRAIVDQAAAQADATVHLAAVASVGKATENPDLACAVNVTGTLNVLEGARWNGHSRFVYMSSAAVYGLPRALPLREDSPTVPVGVYGASKLAGEAMTHAFRTTYGLSTVALRLFNVYGPRQKSDQRGVIQSFIEDSAKKGQVIVYGDGRQSFDFVFVEDAAEAVRKALRSDATGPFNIGTGKMTSVNELVRFFVKRKPQLEIVRAEARPGEVKRSRASTARAAHVLGWHAKASLSEGLRRSIGGDAAAP
jgi:UDP-glucose 4-epimerase